MQWFLKKKNNSETMATQPLLPKLFGLMNFKMILLQSKLKITDQK